MLVSLCLPALVAATFKPIGARITGATIIACDAVRSGQDDSRMMMDWERSISDRQIAKEAASITCSLLYVYPEMRQ